MSDSPLKKQKIENLQNHDINSSISTIEKNVNDYSQLVSLFYYDWFLIEIGRLLMNEDDKNLINILVLNKKINQRATIVFRQHFLNFNLQKEISTLSRMKDFNQIQSIFQREPLALNPNIIVLELLTLPNTFLMTLEGKKKLMLESKLTNPPFPLCIHNPLVLSYCEEPLEHSDCTTLYYKNHLSCAATRIVGFYSLVKMILFHPRMRFEKLTERGFIEISNWAVVNGHFDILELILERSKKSYPFTDEFEDEELTNDFEHSDPETPIFALLEWQYLFAGALIFNRFEILKLLFKHFESVSLPFKNPFISELSSLELCWKFGGGVKVHEFILNKLLDNGKLPTKTIPLANLVDSIHYPSEYLILAAKFVVDLKKSPYFNPDHFSAIITRDLLQRSMEMLLDSSTISDEKENTKKLALTFAFSMSLPEFKNLICENEWTERELFDLFHARIFHQNVYRSPENLVRILLNRLNSQILFLESDFEQLLTSLISVNDEESFKLVWTDRRVVCSEKWKAEFIILHLNEMSMDLIKLLLSTCESLSIPIEFNFRGELLTLEFRNACLLTLMKAGQWKIVEILENQLKINWTEQLLEMTLKVHDTDSYLLRTSNWLLKNKAIFDSLWKKNAIHLVLYYACRSASVHLLILILKRFPDIDLRENNNQAMRVLFLNKLRVSNVIMVRMLESFTSTNFRFKDEFERNEMFEFAKRAGNFQDIILSSILKIKLFGE